MAHKAMKGIHIRLMQNYYNTHKRLNYALILTLSENTQVVFQRKALLTLKIARNNEKHMKAAFTMFSEEDYGKLVHMPHCFHLTGSTIHRTML